MSTSDLFQFVRRSEEYTLPAQADVKHEIENGC